MTRLNVCDSGVLEASKHLHQGNVIAYPTEAVWGLGCDPNCRTAVERILDLKQRDMEKGLILVAGSMDQLQPLLEGLSPEQREKLEASWPGPVTWIIPDPECLYPEWIRGAHTSVAVRVSAHSRVIALCSAFGGPIVSTSANEAGAVEIRSRLTLERQFGLKIDFIMPGQLGVSDRPSEIRDLLSGKILR